VEALVEEGAEAIPVAEEEAEPPAAAVPESLQALVDAGILDESDLESALAEMTDEQLAAQREEEIPDWLRELTAEEAAPAAEMAEEALPVEEVEGPPLEPSTEPVPESLEALMEAGILDEADLESAMAQMTEEELEAQREEEIPEWLRELSTEEEVSAEETPAEEVAPPVEEVVPEIQAAKDAEEVIEEAAPAAEEELAEMAVAEQPAVEAGEELVEPEAEPALVEAPTLEEEVIEPLPAEVLEELELAVEMEELPVAEEEEEGKAGPPLETEMVAPYDRVEVEERLESAEQIKELQERLRGQPRDFEARLELARLLRRERDWNTAMNHYEKLISARQFLPTVIDELSDLVDEEVNLPRLYQLIGDAHMQEGDLDKALEMYRTAQKVLME
jgi:tetratricopeptide (TPR) repeat protein